MALCRVLAAVLLIHSAGGSLGAEVRSSIVGGRDAQVGGWPWMVHLNITTNSRNKWRCGGSILNSQWVLTAAHCLDREKNPDLRRSMVWVGSHSLQKRSVRYLGIEKVTVHPGYQSVGGGGGYLNDIALVKLKKKLELTARVAAVKLPAASEDFGTASECWITGWGYIRTNMALPAPETLQQLKIPIIPLNVCKRVYPALTPDSVCAGDMAGGMGACRGDYGGPLVCRAAGGFVQVGVMSYGSEDGCALPQRPDVYARVSKYLSFINDNIHSGGEEASAEV